MLLSIDEKTSIQALERGAGHVFANDGRIVGGVEHTYKRRGTVSLFMAPEVVTGTIHTQTTTFKHLELLAFADQLLTEVPAIQDRESHVIFDNYYMHKCNESPLAPRRHFRVHADLRQLAQSNQNLVWRSHPQRALCDGSFPAGRDEHD